MSVSTIATLQGAAATRASKKTRAACVLALSTSQEPHHVESADVGLRFAGRSEGRVDAIPPVHRTGSTPYLHREGRRALDPYGYRAGSGCRASGLAQAGIGKQDGKVETKDVLSPTKSRSTSPRSCRPTFTMRCQRRRSSAEPSGGPPRDSVTSDASRSRRPY
jgi:hypothetical protein